MNKDLLNFIRSLSENDKKNLSQKTLKTCEEVGELAKAVLPYENASGTKHRFIDRGIILDNVADVVLSALSVAYDLGFTDDEVEEMMETKATKWLGIQAKEDKVKFPIPFEIHVTVKNPKSIEKFKTDCADINVKPILIDLQKGTKSVMLDAMTSSVHYGDNTSSYIEMLRITTGLITKGYEVLRQKIETVPWHPAAPSNADAEAIMPKNCYFESHLQVVTTEERKWELEKIVIHHNAHLSRNFFKKVSDTEYIIMITYRNYAGTIESFKEELEALKDNLVERKFTYEKEVVEFSIYDTKISHDSAWIKGL
jgi:NTP pyrophosphatase (non-canonical NTP hydrolase)